LSSDITNPLIPTPGRLKSKKMLEAARDQSCVNCGAMDGTVVAAHYQGMRSHLFGKGTGLKPHDICIADLCSKCHRLFDDYLISDCENRDQRRIDHSEQFLYCIIQTLVRRARQGVLKI